MLSVWSPTSFPVFTFKCMDTELSACKHSKVSVAVLYQLGAQSPLLAGCQMSGLLYLKNHYSVILTSYFIYLKNTWVLPFRLLPVRLLSAANRSWESMPWVSWDATSLFCQAQMVGKNDGFQSAWLGKIWTVASFRYHDLASKILIEHH